MKLIELEINNVRGIPYLLLKPEGKNFLIYGPNGSGKSTVVDSIDFLLTGKISRLTGEGTKDLSLSKHGTHIKHQPEDAIVRAKIKIPDLSTPIELKRCMARPSILEYDETHESYISAILELAKRGQYVLTRRDILKYITSTPNTRATQIQALLNIQDIEVIRKMLVKISNKYESNLKSLGKSLESAKQAINDTIGQREFDKNAILHFINSNRAFLKGHPLTDFNSRNLKSSLSIRIEKTRHAEATVDFNKTIQYLLEIILNKKKFFLLHNALRSLAGKMHKIPKTSRELSRLELTRLGVQLIDETGDCPLCDTPWEKGELEKKLKERLSNEKEIVRIHYEFNKSSMELKDEIIISINKINDLLQFLSENEIEEDIELFRLWQRNLSEYHTYIKKLVKVSVESPFDDNNIRRFIAPLNIEDSLKKIQKLLDEKRKGDITLLELTPEQKAWDNLTHLEENLKMYEKTINNFTLAKNLYEKAKNLSEYYQQAKDNVLNNLYEEINEKFIELYKKLHGNDENDFTASIKSDGSGVNFEVDFYGCGSHPPHALHSEGHQDSMGLCLYLALAEKVNLNLIEFTILDDVVMSVDIGHRKNICKILKECFPEQQFLITTHDKTWTNQLKYESVVNSKEIIEFYNWDINTGPHHFNYQVDIWNPIERDLERNDVPSAAARLRRGLEQFFGIACNDLQAPVVFKSDGRWELGHFFRAAVSRYGELLKKAKVSAQSWNQDDTMEKYRLLDSNKSQILQRTQAEQWTVNASVHYNNWINLSVSEFRPVVEAFHDLCLMFKCHECGGMLYLITRDHEPASARCNCGNENWNLIKNRN